MTRKDYKIIADVLARLLELKRVGKRELTVSIMSALQDNYSNFNSDIFCKYVLKKRLEMYKDKFNNENN